MIFLGQSHRENLEKWWLTYIKIMIHVLKPDYKLALQMGGS